jgi:hypothetical protein
MAVLFHDIPVIEAFLILTMLLLGSLGFQAVTHKQYFTSVEDIKEVLRWVVKGSVGLAFLVIILQAIVLIAK